MTCTQQTCPTMKGIWGVYRQTKTYCLIIIVINIFKVQLNITACFSYWDTLDRSIVYANVMFETKYTSTQNFQVRIRVRIRIACNSIEVYISGKLVTWTFVQIQNTHKIRIAAILGFECGENNVPKKILHMHRSLKLWSMTRIKIILTNSIYTSQRTNSFSPEKINQKKLFKISVSLFSELNETPK